MFRITSLFTVCLLSLTVCLLSLYLMRSRMQPEPMLGH